jgi:hypothetical protein
MTNKFITIISLFIAVIVLSGCSVYKAASNEGVSVSDVSKCKKKGCFLSLGMDIIDNHKNENGSYTETYRAVARKGGGNYIRAAGHGVLDVATLGLWEVAGTPVEGALSNNRGFITVMATYAHKEAPEIDHMEIYDANGNKVIAKK